MQTFLTFDYLRDLSLRVGQYKPFFSREFIAGWGDLLFVDRSIVQNEFHPERDVGFDLFSADLAGLGLLRYYTGVYAGQGRSSLGSRPFRMMYLARVEVMPLGLFDDYRESDIDRNPRPKLAFGGAYAYLDRAAQTHGVYGGTPADGGTTDIHEVEGDLTVKFRGLSLNAEGFWRRSRRHSGGAVDESGALVPVEAGRSGAGYFGQAGWLVPKIPFELAIRGGQIFSLGNSSRAPADEIGGGINYYFAGHAFKLQLDYFHLHSSPTPWGDGENMVRLQLQLQV